MYYSRNLIAQEKTCSKTGSAEKFENKSLTFGSGKLVSRSNLDESKEGQTDIYHIIGMSMVVGIIGLHYSMDKEKLLGKYRGSADYARARQIAMYLLHTTLSVSYQKIAELFKRDRTTVAHACRLIEDLRDEQQFDQEIAQLEALVTPLTWISSSDGGNL